MKRFHNFIFTGCVFLLIAVSIFISSCQVGLGGTVDYKAPTVTITSHTSGNSVLNGTTEFSGTWEDDTGVTEIDFTLSKYLKDSQTYEEVDTFKISIPSAETEKKSGSWSYEFDTTKYPETDYQLAIVATDTSKTQSQQQILAFSIDNTAPLITLDKPNSLNFNDPALFGREVKISGYIEDAHSIKSLDVKVFKANADGSKGEEITLPKSSFSVSSGALTKYIARYYSDDARADLSDEESLIYENYVAIYGDKNSSNWNKNQNYIFEISASDKVGNVTDKLYLNDNLKSLIKAATDKDIELSTTEMRNILEDNYTDNAITESQVAVVKEILKGTYDQSSLSETYTYLVNNEDSLYGTINSRANPTYTANGCILGESTWGQVSSGGTLSFTVNSGSDGASFKPNVINLALYPCDEDGNIIDKVDGTTVYTKIEVPQDYIKNSNNKSIKDLETTVTIGSYSFTLTDMLDSEGEFLIKAGEYYKIEVTGYDLKNNDIIASFDSDDNEYEFGFKVIANDVKPEVTFANDKEFVKADGIADTIPVTISVSKAKKVVVSAYVQTKEGKYTFGDAIVTEGTKVIDSKEYALTDGVVTVNVPLNFDVTKLERGKNWTVGIHIIAINGEADCDETFYVYADDAAPEVAFKGKLLTAQKNNYEIGLITEADSLYEKDEKGNCTYTYTGTWSDIGGSGTDILYYSTDNGKTWSEFDSDEAPQATSKLGWTKALAVTEGGPYTLSFKAKDSVGNESDVITFTGEYFDFAAPTITIEGDKKAYRNDATAPVFTITAEDTNALSALDVVVKKNGTAVDSGNGYTLTKNTDDTKKFTAKVITTEEAEWTIEATAKDCQNRTASIDTLSFVYDKTAPKWYEDSTNYVTVDGKKWNSGVENWYNATAMTFKGFLEESVSGIAKVKYVIQPAGTTDEASQISGSVVTTAVKDKAALSYYEATLSGLVSGTEANTVTFTPVDKADNEGTPKTFSIYVDNKTPKVESDVSGTKYTDGKAAVTLTGTVEDDDSGFAADSVVITAGSTNVTATLDTTSEGYSKNKAKWTAEIPADALADNKATDIYATVTDRAGMEIPNKLCIYYVDTTAPVVNFKGKLDSALKNSNVVGLITEEDAPDGTFTVSGSWSDVNGSGTSKLYYKFDTDANWNEFGTSDAPTSDSLMNWSKALTVEQGTAERTLSFYAEDKVGNTSDVVTFTGIKFDFALPEVKITSGTVADYYKEGDTPEFTVEATDTNKISALNLTVTKDGATVAADDYATAGITVTETTTDNKITKVITLTEDGSWNITAQAVDSTGRKSSTETISTIFDTKKPVWKEDKDFVPKVGGNPYTTATWYNSTSLQFSGYYTEEGSGISYIEYELYEAGSDVAKTSSKFTTSDKGSYESFEATLSGFIASNSANKVVFTPVDKAGNRGDSKEFEIHVDCSSPTIYIDSSIDRNKYAQKNEPITLTGTIKDDASGFNSGSVKVKVGNITESAVNAIVDTSSEGYSSTNAKWTATIPTSVLSSLTENEQTVVTVDVSDAAGNTSSTTACTIIIDTKKPEISFKNRLGKAVTDATYKVGLITKSDSLNYDSENKKFTYEISGDWTDNKGSGTKLLEYCINDGDWKSFDDSEAPVSSGKTNWSKTLEVQESKKDEAMTLAFRATDGVGLVSDIVTFTDIRFDYESPALSVDKSEIYNYYTADTGAPEFTITAEDTNAIESFEITVTKDGVEASSGDGYTLVKDTTSTTTQTAKITVSEEAKWSVKTNVADCQGQKSELDTIAFVYDKTAPAWTDEGETYYTTVGGEKYDSTNPWYKESAMNFKGYVDEVGSGIEKIVWTLTPASGSSDSGEIVATKVDGTDKYSYTQAISGFVSGTGENKVTLIPYDKAGNKGTPKEFSIYVDNEAPEVTVSGDTSKYTNAKSAYVLSGTVTDEASGFGDNAVTVKVGDTAVDVTLSKAADGLSATWTASVPASVLSALSEGTKATVTVTVTDKAGNPKPDKNSAIIKDITAPVINFKNKLGTAVSGGAQSDGTYKVGLITESDSMFKLSDGKYTYEVSGDWTDNGGSGTKTFEYKVNDGEWTSVDSSQAPTSANKTNWSTTIEVSETKAATPMTLSFRATDEVGLSETVEFTGIYFDYAKPTVTITPATTGYVTEETTYTLTAEDTNELKNFNVVLTKNGATATSGYTLTDDSSSTANKKIKTLVITEEGKWNIQADATDGQNRSADKVIRTLTYDKTAPAWTGTAIVDGKDWDSTAKNWYSSSALTFKDSLTEEVSGMDRVDYVITDANGNSKEGTVVPSEGTNGAYTYETTLSGFASGSSANTVTFTPYDNAGNSGTARTFSIYVDKNAPTFSFTKDSPQYIKGSTAVTLTGSVEDDASGLASDAVKVKISGTTTEKTATLDYADSSDNKKATWTVTFNSTELNTSSANNFVITVTDVSGNANPDQKLCTYYVDSTAPVITFKGDLLKAQSNGNAVGLITEDNASLSTSAKTFTVSGTWSDGNGNVSGTGKLYYKYGDATWAEITEAENSTNWSKAIAIDEGTTAKSLSFYAVDAIGNGSESDAVTFTDLTFDFAAPTVSVAETVKEYYKSGETPKFTVEATDTNKISALNLTITKDGKAVAEADYATSGITVKTTTSDTEIKKEVTLTKDGIWNISAQAKDAVNRDSTAVAINTTVDTVLPAWTDEGETYYTTVGGKKYDSTNPWYKESAMNFKGYVDEAGSGIEKIVWTLTSASGSSDSGEIVATKVDGTDKYSYTQAISGFVSGTNTVTLTPVDKAGNEGTSKEFTIKVDNEAPEVTVTGDPSKYTKATEAYVLSGTVTDKASGFGDDAVTVTVGSTAVDVSLNKAADGLSATWTASVPASVLSALTEGTKATVEVTVTDKARNPKSDKNSAIIKDTTAPTLTFKGDLLKAQTNGNAVGWITEDKLSKDSSGSYTYTVSGSWSDGDSNVSGTGKLYYKYGDAAWAELTEAENSTNWSKSIAISAENADAKTLSFKAVDKVGNESTSPVTFTDLKFDWAAPTVSVAETVKEYYKNGETPLFTITATDSNKISALNLTITKGGVTVAEADYANSGITVTTSTTTDTKITKVVELASDGIWNISAQAKDEAGHSTTSAVVSTIIDTTAPAWLEDSTYTPTVGGKDWDSTTEATDNHSWFKSSSLKFEGYFTESGSGIKEIKWSLTPAGTSTATVGTITASDKGAYETFATTIDGFTAGTNTITFTPVDYAGNEPATGKQFTIYIDDVAPDYSLTDSTAILTNQVTPVTLKGTATDANSGIDSVVVSITGITNASVTATLTDVTSDTTTKNWSATFDNTVLGNLKDKTSYSIKVTVKDKAGNEVPTTATSISVDTTAPKVTISTPSNTTSLNGKHALSGKVTETSPKSLELYWSTSTDTTLKTDGTLDDTIWTKFHSATELSGIYNWTTENLDFTDISKAKSAKNGNATVYILPVAKDSAGNCNIYTYDGKNYTSNIADQRITYTVDMNTDRPVIKFNELADVEGTLRKYTNQISGTLSDDDTVTAFKIYATTDSKDTNIPTTLDAWQKYTQEGKLDWTANSSTTSFTYEPNHITKDGTIYVYFFVTDSEGDSFFTGATSTLSQPYVMYKGATDNVDNSDEIAYTTDSKQPQISSKAYFAGKDGDAVNAAETSDATKIDTTITIGGANKKFIKFIVTASDDNGIKSVTGKVNSVELTFTEQSSTKTTTTSTWISKAVSVASVASGQYTAEITVTDNSDLTYPDTISVTVDNDGPEFGKINPSMTAVQVGEVSVSGFLSDKYSSVSTLKYLIGTDTVREYSDTEIYEKAMKDDTQYNAGSVEAFEFDFDNSEGSGESAHTDYKNPKLPTTDAELENYKQSTEGNQIYNIPIYFVAEDDLGNYTVYKDFYVHYNPYADRPTTEILYPSDGATLSGQIRLSGSAVDNEEVGSVYYQIMPTSSSTYTTWEAAKAWATSLGLTVVDSSSTELSGGNFDADPDFWGIKATNTVSWYANLNDEVSLIKDECKDADSKNYLITVRAVAIDAKNTLGNWSDEVKIVLNPDAPAFGSIEAATLKQFADSVTDFTTATATSSLEISGTTYLKGQWYYVTTVTHTNGIKEISYSLDDSSSVALVKAKTIENSNSNTVKAIGGESDNYSGYQIWIPLGTNSGSGTKTLTVSATTGNDVSGQKTEVFTYDNEAPTIEGLYHTSVDTEFIEGAVLTNNNNQLVIGGTVDDTTAGIDKVLFYFYREGTDTIELAKRIYDPMFNNYDATSKTKSEILTSTLLSEDITSSIPLYGITQNVNVGEDGKALTLATESDHIRAGGLAKINGIYYTISKVDGTTVTLKTSCGVTGSVSAFFPIAQVVDNTSAEKVSKFTTDEITFTGNTDDGDGMPESLTGTGTTKTWEASIHGNWLPDGPVTLVVIAFDKSGNASATSIDASIQNNRPRLSKVSLGTNLDGSVDGNSNATYSDNEFETYNILGIEGASQEVYDLTTANYKKYINGKSEDSTRSAFIAKNKLAVVPEFVGGNGEIQVIFNNKDETSTSDGKMTKGDVTDGHVYALAAKKGTLSTETTGNTTVLGDYFEFGTELGDDADSHPVSFTFWDSTELTTPGTDSQYCFLRIKDLKVAQTDNTAPNVVINPFFWEDSENNSLYEGSTSNGHIELEADWMATAAYDTTNAEYDGDPKVSGKIVLRGTAYDDRALAGLYFKVTNSSGSSVFTTTGTTTEELSGTNYYIGATYANSTWTSNSSDLATNGWAMTIDSADNAADETYNYFGQNGHKVHWELALDTEKITGVAATDITVTVAAVDTKPNNSTGRTASDATDDATAHKPEYKMDVVPYITGVKSGLSKQKVAKSSVYDRTAKGHYPVSSAETVYVTGFNLKGGSLNDSSSTAKTAALTAVTDATSLTWYSSVAVPSGSVYSVASIASFTSGNVSVAVNSISSLNNLNNNDGKGSYTKENTSTIGDYSIYSNYYNRQPNSDNNNLLTDDVVFDVWQFNSAAAKVKESGYLVEPIMKINPKNDMIGFAFNNGPAYFSMANGTSTSFTLWQRNYARNTTTGFTIDSNGVSHGITVGLDTNPNSGHAGRMTYMNSSWGVGYTNGEGGNYNGYHTSRIDSIGLPSGTYNGVAYSSNLYVEERFSSPSLTTAVHSDGTYVYLAYYDDVNGQIRFRWGNTSNAKANDSNGYGYTFDQIADQTKMGITSNSVFESNATYYSVPASSSVKYVGTSIAYAGEYVSIAVIPGSTYKDDVVVMTWYDATESCWWYSYKENPCNDNDMSSTHGNGYWSTPIMLMDNAGEHCKIAVDANKGIHMAAYDIGDANLVYAYLPTYSSRSPKLAVVDSYSITGTNITLDVGLTTVEETTYAVPHIGYYSASTGKAKVASLNEVISNGYAGDIPAGATSDYFTGAWEVSTLPTTSRLRDDYINVGLWKDTDGKIKAPDASKSSAKTSKQSGDTGYCYGNGTANAVLGYAIKVGTLGYVETAQLK